MPSLNEPDDSPLAAYPSPLVQLGEIRQIALTVRDVVGETRFFRDVLGLTFLFSPDPSLAFFAAGNVRLMLGTGDGGAPVGGNSVLYFKVADVETIHKTLVERGAVDAGLPHLIARMPDHELWIGFVRDPEGNTVGLLEERASGG